MEFNSWFIPRLSKGLVNSRANVPMKENRAQNSLKTVRHYLKKSKTLKQRPNFEKTLWPSDCMVAQTDSINQIN